MTTMISVVAEDDSTYTVQSDGATVEPPVLEPDDVCGNCGGDGVVRESAAFPQLVECGSCHGGVI